MRTARLWFIQRQSRSSDKRGFFVTQPPHCTCKATNTTRGCSAGKDPRSFSSPPVGQLLQALLRTLKLISPRHFCCEQYQNKQTTTTTAPSRKTPGIESGRLLRLKISFFSHKLSVGAKLILNPGGIAFKSMEGQLLRINESYLLCISLNLRWWYILDKSLPRSFPKTNLIIKISLP